MSCITRSNLPLNEHQKKVVNFLKKDSVRGLLVVHTVGTGKTLTSITASQCFLDEYPSSKVIVITPTSLQGNFKKELKAYGASPNDERYIFFTIQGFTSAVKNKKISASFCKDAMIIVDEAHNLRTRINIGTDEINYAKTITKCAKHAKKVMLLTATPFINHPSEVINLLSIIDGVDPISVSQFKHMTEKDLALYFKCKISFYNPTIESRSEFFPKMISEDVFILMSPEYYKHYQRIEMYPTTSEFAFYNGVRKGSNSLEGTLSPKINWIMSKLKDSEPNQKFVIFSHFLGDGLKLLMRRMENENISYDHITGDVMKDNRSQIVKDYNENRIKVLLISKAGGEGLDLSNTHSIIIMEPAWNEATHQQVIGRAIRFKSHYTLPKSEQKVYVYRLYHIKPSEKSIIHKAVKERWLKNVEKNDDILSIDLYLRNAAINKQDAINEFMKFVREHSIEVRKCTRNDPYVIDQDNTLYKKVMKKTTTTLPKSRKVKSPKSRKVKSPKSRKVSRKSRKVSRKSRKVSRKSRKVSRKSRKVLRKVSRKTSSRSSRSIRKNKKE